MLRIPSDQAMLEPVGWAELGKPNMTNANQYVGVPGVTPTYLTGMTIILIYLGHK